MTSRKKRMSTTNQSVIISPLCDRVMISLIMLPLTSMTHQRSLSMRHALRPVLAHPLLSRQCQACPQVEANLRSHQAAEAEATPVGTEAVRQAQPAMLILTHSLGKVISPVNRQAITRMTMMRTTMTKIAARGSFAHPVLTAIGAERTDTLPVELVERSSTKSKSRFSPTRQQAISHGSTPSFLQ